MNPSPYESPQAIELDATSVMRSKKRWGWAALICAFIVVLPIIIAALVIVQNMKDAYAELGKTGSGDPAALASDISMTLLSAFWALVFSVPALIGMIVCLVKFRRQKIDLHQLEASRASAVSETGMEK